MPQLFTPSKDDIAELAPLDQLGLENIVVVASRAQAEEALQLLHQCAVLGFDTESKPTFVRDEVSSGPHVVQFSTRQTAYVFQLHDDGSREVVRTLLQAAHIIKVGFGLAGDHQQIRRTLNIEPRNVLDLNHVFRSQGYIKEIGIRGAVAVVFKRRFIKSRKATTSNWANRQLTPSQVIYSGNDAWAALLVFEALDLPSAAVGQPGF